MKEINVTVIGSGSTYCPELVDGFIKQQSTLKLKRLVLMDIDERKRTIVGNLCIRQLKNAGVDCEVALTDDLEASLEGADFVVTQIRVGKLPARHLDETIPLEFDLIGQETTGIGGFFKALRTIPVMKNIADAIEKICPDAWLINFTNPSGIIAEFVQNHTNVKSIGLCNLPINMLCDVQSVAGEDADITYLGLNHLSWITSVKKDGVELIDKLFEEGFAPEVMKNIHDDGFAMECLRAVKGYPCSYLQYYYDRDKKLAYLKEQDESRAQVCMEIEEDLLKLYADENLVEKPALLDLRGGHKYSLAAVSLINAIANDLNEVHVVNIKNNGALDFMRDDDIVEIAAAIGKDGAVPVKKEYKANRHIIGLMRIVKEYEKFTVIAGMEGDDDAAMNALMLHPLVGDFESGFKCYNKMKEAHAAHLPQFNKK
ncbi:MAG: 6-phospho-beta-glucosidase [Oscillospiraceae bacterium]|nr:6-phospho-beta-glucosidase [Oscillospiraceae bacterium]